MWKQEEVAAGARKCREKHQFYAIQSQKGTYSNSSNTYFGIVFIHLKLLIRLFLRQWFSKALLSFEYNYFYGVSRSVYYYNESWGYLTKIIFLQALKCFCSLLPSTAMSKLFNLITNRWKCMFTLQWTIQHLNSVHSLCSHALSLQTLIHI